MVVEAGWPDAIRERFGRRERAARPSLRLGPRVMSAGPGTGRATNDERVPTRGISVRGLAKISPRQVRAETATQRAHRRCAHADVLATCHVPFACRGTRAKLVNARMRADSLRFQLAGSLDDGGLVRLGDFIAFLERLSGTFDTIDHAVNTAATSYFRITGLDVGSAVVTLQEHVRRSKARRAHTFIPVTRAFDELLAKVERKEALPVWATPRVIEKVRDLTEPSSRASLSSIDGPTGNFSGESLHALLTKMLGPIVQSRGSVTGQLDAVNFHTTSVAYIYPDLGRRVTCDFLASLRRDVVAALTKRVTLYGIVSRRADDIFPYHVAVESITILPDSGDLPQLRSLIGSLKMSVDPVDFIRSLRDAE